MRLSTMTKVTFAVAAGLSIVGAGAWAQNLRVMGTTTGEGAAYFNQGLAVTGTISMRNPSGRDANGNLLINGFALERTNEEGRGHAWKLWNMNTPYGQDSLQIYEYQTELPGGNPNPCLGDPAKGAMCAPRFTIRKGGHVWIGGTAGILGNVGVGTDAPSARLTVATSTANDGIRLVGAANTLVGLFTNLDNGSYNALTATGDRALIYQRSGGLVIAPWGGGGGLRFDANGKIGVGAGAPAVQLAVNGNGTNVYATDVWVENNLHVQGNEALAQGGRGRLRVGTAWGYPGIYAEPTSTGGASDLVLGASSGLIRANASVVVTGALAAPQNPAVYWCPPVGRTKSWYVGEGNYESTSVTYCGMLSLASSCTFTHSTYPETIGCTLAGRLIQP